MEVGAAYKKGNSVRVVKEYHPGNPDKRQEVVYALYRKQMLWHQHLGKYVTEWWYCREGYCSEKTWDRWVRGAEELE